MLFVGLVLASCKARVDQGASVTDAASAPALQGVVRSVTGDGAFFSTADRDLEVDLRRLSPPVAALLKANVASKDVIAAELPPDSFKEIGRPALGVRADCSELPLSLDAAAKLAAASSGINDFIARLPAGTMQTFTLVYESHSPLAEDVSYD